EAATDAQLRAEILSYSRSRGLFVGLSVEGAAMMLDAPATDAFYRTPPQPVVDPRTGAVVGTIAPEEKLLARLASLTGSAVAPAVPGPPPAQIPPPPAPPHP